MRLLQVVIAVCLIVFTITVLTCNGEETPKATEIANNELAGSEQQNVRNKFRLQNVLKFDQFKSLFGKVYGSVLEEMVRQKIFLGRAFHAFISVLKYKHFQLSHYLSLNPMSDQTPEERARHQVSADSLREISADFNIEESKQVNENDKYDDDNDDEMIPVAEIDDIERELEQHKDEEGYRELVDELNKQQQQQVAENRRRKRRDTASRTSAPIDNLLFGNSPSKLSPGTQRKIRLHPNSNNPNYEQPELSSSAANGAAQDQSRSPDEGFMNFVMKLPGANYVKNVIEDFSEQRRAATYHAKKSDWPDEVFSDLRTTNCFFQPRQQTNCGSCYAFTAISYYEYFYCRRTGSLTPFSEQYIVDCGHLTDLNGCSGGRLSKTITFIETYGLELRHNYPYRSTVDTCPYEENPDPSKMGYIKLDYAKGVGALMFPYFDKLLDELKPIMFTMNLSPDFHDYGGGVHDKYDCSRKSAHAMLIIGHGREDGIEYYLLRNSYSVFWGEQGYYKISKDSLLYCRSNDFGLVSLGQFSRDESSNLNKRREISAVKNRYADYLDKAAQGEFKDLKVY